MDNAWDSMSQHELLAELDIVERAICRTSTFDRQTDEVGRTRLRVSRELLAVGGARIPDRRRATPPTTPGAASRLIHSILRYSSNHACGRPLRGRQVRT